MLFSSFFRVQVSLEIFFEIFPRGLNFVGGLKLATYEQFFFFQQKRGAKVREGRTVWQRQSSRKKNAKGGRGKKRTKEQKHGPHP